MKPAGLHLLLFVLAGSLAAQEPAETPKATKTSTRLGQEIRASLPKYTPPPPTVLGIPSAIESDPNVLALPKMTVKEYRPPTHDPDVWLSKGALQQKSMIAYKRSMTDLEWALNSWFIPLFSAPPSARARGYYRGEKFNSEVGRIQDLLKKIAVENPGASAELNQELRNLVEGRLPGSK